MSSIAFTPWPEALAAHYRQQGYWLDLPLTDILSRQLTQSSQAIALICGERQWSYAELDARSSRLAGYLYQQGLRRYDTALVQLPNVAEFYLVYFALLKLGVVAVHALYSHQRLELSAYAEQIQPNLLIGCSQHPLFADAAFSHSLQRSVPNLTTVVMLGACDYAPDLQQICTTALAAPLSQPTAAREVAFFQLSGGSTGTPKLIPRTHDDYYYSIRCSAHICQLTPQTRFLCALPAGHNFPLSSPGALGVLYAGGTVVLAANPEPLNCFALIERHQVTMTALVPSAVALWLAVAAAHRTQLRSLQLLQVGGANFAEALARRVPSELGCQLQQVFGMAEGLVNYTRLDDSDERIFTTQGRPMSPADEVRVLDEEGHSLAAGCVGRLATRGPYTFRGYYQSPEYNAHAFDNEGFYYSGDLVEQDADGYLRVVGRVKDQINRGGEKIAAEEIESLLLRHPLITQAALVAMPDALLGEKSCAFIVSADAKLGLLQVRKYLRAQGLAEYKLPDRVERLTQLPLTAVGKTNKPRLRQYLHALLEAAPV